MKTKVKPKDKDVYLRLPPAISWAAAWMLRETGYFLCEFKVHPDSTDIEWEVVWFADKNRHCAYYTGGYVEESLVMNLYGPLKATT